MISDGELKQMIREGEDLGYSTIVEVLVELEAYRPCQHNWNVLRLTEGNGRYQYCTLCGAKKVAE